jgi:hypothetical protein
MDRLRQLSNRPELLRDEDSAHIIEQASETLVGTAGSLSRDKVVSALPLHGGPITVLAPIVLHDEDLAYLADPSGNLIGVPGIVVHRMLSARWTEDTRRLSG